MPQTKKLKLAMYPKAPHQEVLSGKVLKQTSLVFLARRIRCKDTPSSYLISLTW